MLDATQTTLRAAQFFYRQMIEAQKGRWMSEPGAFQHFYSAFIQVGRNVTWAMRNDETNKYLRWEPEWRKQLTPKELELEDFTNERRIDEVKRGGADMVAVPEEVPIHELVGYQIQMGRPAYLMEAQPGLPGTTPLKYYRPAPHFETEDGKVKVIEVCKTYLDYLEKKVPAFESTLAAMATKQYPRGTAFHEAGHAVVAWSLGLKVRDIHISDDDASGGAKIECPAKLPFIEQLAICIAGYAAEKVFGCPAHENAAAEDRQMVLGLLKGIPEDQAVSLRDEGYNCARNRLETHTDKVLKLVERLVESGYVDGREFKRWMRG
jgi:Peptidase M50B-like